MPDLRYDVDALFKHMVKNLGHTLSTPMQWDFCFEGPLAKLKALKKKLEKVVDEGTEVGLVDTLHIDGDTQTKGKSLVVQTVAALSAKQVKTLADTYAKLGKEAGVSYEGVESYEPVNEEELFGWMGVDDAQWRLRHFQDLGLKPNGKIEFIFGFAADKTELAALAASLKKTAGVKVSKPIDDPFEGLIIEARCAGKNNDTVVSTTYKAMEKAAKAAKARLVGMQFGE